MFGNVGDFIFMIYKQGSLARYKNWAQRNLDSFNFDASKSIII